MALRASATAEICFGPVPVWVKLYSVAAEKSVTLSQVHAECGGKLERQLLCAEEGVPVAPEATGKQYRFPDGTVTTLTDEDVKSAQSERFGTIEIQECVPEDSIDPAFLGKTMFVGPNEEGGIDGYSTLVDALAETRTAAIGTYYAQGRDQLVVIQRYRERGLLLREVYYASEIRPFAEIELPRSVRGTLMAGAFEMWTRAIAVRRKDGFEAGAYSDGYPERLLRAAEKKAGERGSAGAGPVNLLAAARKRAVKGAGGAKGTERGGAGGAVHALGERGTGERPSSGRERVVERVAQEEGGG